MAKANQSKYAVLGMLSFEPMSGYDIKANFERSVGHFWQMSYTQIYAMLKRLAEEGWVTKAVEQTAVGRPDRFVYSITEAGRETLRHWLLQPPIPQPVRRSLSLKLFFGHEVAVDDVEKQLNEHLARLQATLVEYEAIEAAILADPETAVTRQHHPNYILMTLRRGLYQVEAEIKWCEESLTAVAVWRQEAAKP